jgi:hypothetical protein
MFRNDIRPVFNSRPGRPYPIINDNLRTRYDNGSLTLNINSVKLLWNL